MKNLKFAKAEFLLSALDNKSFPIFKQDNGQFFPEIVIAGKSNVGKSSLINHLLNAKKLAHISSKPGKTTTINFYKVDNQVILLDFPGYGYAKQSQELKKQWVKNFDIFLNERKTIKLLLLLIDSRRDVSADDIIFYKWAAEKNIPCGIILTKSDKLKKNALNNKNRDVLNVFQKECATPPKFCICYSINVLEGKKILVAQLRTHIGDE